MAYAYVWPPSLPQAPLTDYSETSGALILRTPMDAGPAKLRRRGQRPDTLSVVYGMTRAQLVALAAFVQDTIKGTARFGLPHPRTGATVEVRIVPGQDGELYGTAYGAPDFWRVSLTFEVLP